MTDDEDIISSISKGYFFFKPDTSVPEGPEKKRRRSDIKKNQFSRLSARDYFKTFHSENKEDCARRFDTHLACWQDLETQVKAVQNALNESIFKDILKFVRDFHEKKHQTHSVTEIPTAALVTGVNVPDHHIFFSTIVSRLKENVSPFVALLQSRVCSNLKLLVKAAFDSLVSTPDDDNDDEEETVTSEYEDEDGYCNSAPKKRKKASVFKKYTFTELKEWYQNNCLLDLESTTNYISSVDNISIDREEDSFKSDESKKSNENAPIIFIFEDFERFPSTVLQDFILICSEYIGDLPIILLLGISTAVTTVHRLLPHFVSSKLSIQKFQSQPSIVCLTQVIDKVIISDRNAFKLGPRVFRLLYEHFLYHDFSINNFVRGLKFSVMEHFGADPSRIMCCNDSDDIDNYIDQLGKRGIDNIKNIQSFTSYIEKKPEREQVKLENDNQLVKGLVKDLIKKLQAQEQLFYPVVKCLYSCTSKLPTYPLGKRLRDVYEYCAISCNITKEKRFDSAMTLLRMLSRDELLPILQSCEQILNTEVVLKTQHNPLKSEVAALTKLISKFDDLDKIVEEEEHVDVEDKRKSMPVFKSRYEFTEKLKMAVKEKRKETPYEKLRNSIVDYLVSMFRKHLHSPLSMPFHEIFYYDDVQMVKQRLNGTPRVAIQKALSDPKFYLQCSCCPSNSDEIPGTMPDVCILYKLHLEGGRLINLYDWLQAFICIVDPSIADSSKKKSQKKKIIEEQLQARFIRGVSELQFLGFIKGTRRKTDHVSRLTWGSC